MKRIDGDLRVRLDPQPRPAAAIYRGPEGLAEFLHDQWETFESFAMEPSEFIDRGRHVLVPNTVHARGRSGIEVSAESNRVFTLEHDGRVSRVTMYQQLDEALAAAG